MSTSSDEKSETKPPCEPFGEEQPPKPPPKAETTTTTCVLDPRGDLFVIASGRGGLRGPRDPVRFQVCSRALARSSRVLEVMLYGNFAESRKPEANGTTGTAEWLVQLPDAPPAAMAHLFEIMHCRFLGLDNANMLRQLYDLVTVADCYDSVAVLRPLSHVWVDELRKYNPEKLRITSAMALAWIYYSLGHRVDYERTATALVLDSVPADFNSTAPITALPPLLLDNVSAMRLQLLSKLLEPLYNTVSILIEGSTAPLGICGVRTVNFGSSNDNIKIKQHIVDCEQRLLGLLIREMHRLRLWPRPAVEDIDLAPRVLYNTIKTLAEPRKHLSYGDGHQTCVLNLEPGNLASDGDDRKGLKGLESFRYVASAKEVEFMKRFTSK